MPSMNQKTAYRCVLVACALMATGGPALAGEASAEPVRSPHEHFWMAVSAAGPGLAPLGLATAWLVSLTINQLLVNRRSKLLPAALSNEIALASIGTNPDLEALGRSAIASSGPLANIVRRVLSVTSWNRAERRGALEDAIEYESMKLRRSNGWFDVIYATATLVGLLSAIVGLIEAFSRAGATDAGGVAELNQSIASALSATGLGVALAVVSRVIGEAFRQRHHAIVGELFWRVLPLVDRAGSTGPSALQESAQPIVFAARNGTGSVRS